MEQTLLKVTAPGSLMLLGEHAVLHGRRALVAAANHGITVCLRPAEGRRVDLLSTLGHYRSELDELHPDPSFRFILAALRYYRDQLPGGCQLEIKSDCSSTIGLGTSAAVTAATVGALSAWIGADFSPDQLFAVTRKLIFQVQGCGSGADARAILLRTIGRPAADHAGLFRAQGADARGYCLG